MTSFSKNATGVSTIRTNAGRILLAYLVVSGLMGAFWGGLVLRDGKSGFYAFQGTQTLVPIKVIFVAFCIAWALSGLILIGIWARPVLMRRHSMFLVFFSILSFMYLGFVREPHGVRFGDFSAYYLAAQDMANGVPIQQEPFRLYIYPPLLATVLQPIASLERETAIEFWRFGNLFAAMAMAALLYCVLLRYRFQRHTAAAAVFLVLVGNVPVARTLIYGQVNLWVVDFMLLSLLAYPRSQLMSALALAVAVQLKVYPVLLVVPFLLVRRWRWLVWFTASCLGIVAFTSLINSPSYYLEFLRQARGLTEAGIRNVTPYSLVTNGFRILEIDRPVIQRLLVWATRLALALTVLVPVWRFRRRPLVAGCDDDESAILTGYVVLPPLMLAVSPTIWPHHFTLMLLTVCVMPSVLSGPREGSLFVVAYVLAFLFPVSAIYPAAHLRLAGLGLFGVVLWMVSRRDNADPASWFTSVQTRLTCVAPDQSG